jgi:hypothetical protein
MTATQNPAASGHMPFFITPPGDTDVILHVVGWFALFCVIALGVIFFTIHSLPERMAHRTKKVQLDIVAVLCLLALFTNEHVFWFAALILAFIELPDFLGPVMRIATAIENIAGQKSAEIPDTPETGAALSNEVERKFSDASPKKGAVHG